MSRRAGPTAGVLRPEVNDAVVAREVLAPDPGLAPWVEHYWSVTWDLRGRPTHVAEVFSHPSVHVTVETGTEPRFGVTLPAGLVHGVVTRRFRVELDGAGSVFGVRFRPGGFGAFTGHDVGAWTDRVLPLADAVDDAPAYVAAVLAADHDQRAQVADRWWLDRLPAPDRRFEQVSELMAALRDDPALITVESLAARAGVTERTLQRLFRRYVGVGPKWVVRRYRLQDAVAAIDAGEHDDLAGLAARLGWFDQAHFTREFAAMVGQPPAAYAARRSP